MRVRYWVSTMSLNVLPLLLCVCITFQRKAFHKVGISSHRFQRERDIFQYVGAIIFYEARGPLMLATFWDTVTYLSHKYKSRTSNTPSRCTRSLMTLGWGRGQLICRHTHSKVRASARLNWRENCNMRNRYIHLTHIIHLETVCQDWQWVMRRF